MSPSGPNIQQYRQITYVGGITIIALFSMWFCIQPTFEYGILKNPSKRSGFFMILRAKLTSVLQILKAKKNDVEFNVNDLQKVKFSLYCGSKQDKGLRILLYEKNDKQPPIFRENKKSNSMKVESNKPRNIQTCVGTPKVTNTVNSKNNNTLNNNADLQVPSQKCENVNKYSNENSQWFSNPKTKNISTLKRNYTKNNVNTNTKYNRNVTHNRFYERNSERCSNEYKLTKIKSKSSNVKDIDESQSSNIKDIDDLQRRIHNVLCKIKSHSYKYKPESKENIDILSSLEKIEKSRYIRDSNVISCLKRQLKAEVNFKKEIQTIKNYLDDDVIQSHNEENDPTGKVIPDETFNSKTDSTYSSLEIDIESATQFRILRNLYIQELLKIKKNAEKETMNNINITLDILKLQSKSIVKCKGKMRLSIQKANDNFDKAINKMEYLQGWHNSMVERLEELEDMVDNVNYKINQI
ncbi:490_t:CDS:2 [Diversispora eburnea]|uniref:490_t:CDS:1 n=1 Tax=Diversispora eburnea TaxID=1213867 RepID=A0A9N8UVJ4_9GLOM|nr:490_t:CDS:2 [Diversispora eburnea]